MKIAVDTGGTFTDVILHDGRGGALVAHKLLSTPDDPARAVLDGVRQILAKVGQPEARASVIHGSTVATNALLEGRGGRAAFVTTEGFQDTLHIARQNRPSLYALSPRRPEPPIPRERCLGVAERVGADGAVIEAMDPQAPEALCGALRALGVEAVAVSLLHSYANPAHEEALGAALRQALPDLHVTLSSQLLPEVREYERGATCAVNAVVAPKMGDYLGRLEGALGPGGLRIMASSGGSMTAAEARRAPVHTVLSGPAGGVVGALAMARAASAGAAPRIVTFDMGGTSTDLALCDGDLTLTTEGAVGPLPVRVPLIDIHTVGAGGGSVAWVDVGGALRVGPRSAGADPGPACYGRQTGSPLATVTDAHLLLGRLRADRFLGGAMALEVEASRRAIAQVAAAAGLGLEETALGILRVAEATMARAAKVISVERGHDIRDFTLVCFGGAGGLHACDLATELGMSRVLLPRHPGLLSAVGMLFAHSVHSLSRSVMVRLEAEAPWEMPEVAQALEGLERAACARLEAEGFEVGDRVVVRALDLRYVGQSHELTVPAAGDVLAAFAQRHRALYGYDNPGRAVEVVTARVRAEGRVAPPSLPALPPRQGVAPDGEPVEAWFDRHGARRGRVFERDALAPGDALQGPLIITEYSSTTVVPPGWDLRVDGLGALLLTRQEA